MKRCYLNLLSFNQHSTNGYSILWDVYQIVKLHLLLKKETASPHLVMYLTHASIQQTGKNILCDMYLIVKLHLL